MIMKTPSKQLLLLLILAQQAVSSRSQQVILSNDAHDEALHSTSSYTTAHNDHVVHDTVLGALDSNDDPVDAMLSIHPELASDLAEPRLLHVFGQSKPEWMTEGDKMRLRRQGKKFMDITDHQGLYEDNSVSSWAGKASMDPKWPLLFSGVY